MEIRKYCADSVWKSGSVAVCEESRASLTDHFLIPPHRPPTLIHVIGIILIVIIVVVKHLLGFTFSNYQPSSWQCPSEKNSNGEELARSQLKSRQNINFASNEKGSNKIWQQDVLAPRHNWQK